MPQVDRNPQYITRVVPHNGSNFPANGHQFSSFQQGSVPAEHFNGFSNGYQQFGQAQVSANTGFGGQQSASWITEVVSDNGATSQAPPNLLDDIYRAFNNQLPRI